MQIRSTNTDGATHFGGSVVAAHNSSHGVEVYGGSTGGQIVPIGDDAAISMTIRAKGTGTLTLGDSSNAVSLMGGAISRSGSTVLVGSSGDVVQIAGSTAPFGGMVRVISTAIATPNFNVTGYFGIVSTVTVAGVNSSHMIVANPVNVSTAVLITDVFAGSTAGSINIKWSKQSTITIAASTCTIRFLIFRF